MITAAHIHHVLISFFDTRQDFCDTGPDNQFIDFPRGYFNSLHSDLVFRSRVVAGSYSSIFFTLLKPSKNRGRSRGCTPWAAAPARGEWGSPSRQPIRGSESRENFNKALCYYAQEVFPRPLWHPVRDDVVLPVHGKLQIS